MVGLHQTLWWIVPGIVSESNKVIGDLVLLNTVRGVAHMFHLLRGLPHRFVPKINVPYKN